MEEIQYYKTVYSKFWKNQTKKYGYGTYERNLVGLIANSLPERVFEVGVGTGWALPYGKREYRLTGATSLRVRSLWHRKSWIIRRGSGPEM